MADLPVRDASAPRRAFDVGFGLQLLVERRRKVMAQGLVPRHRFDLQQSTCWAGVFAAHVMGACMRLGMSVQDVVERVTANPARALLLEDRAGALRPGMPADITVFEVEEGEYEIKDTRGRGRTAQTASCRAWRSRTERASTATCSAPMTSATADPDRRG